MWRVRFLAPIFVSCTSPGAGPDVCPNKRHSLSKEVQQEDQPLLRAQGQVVLICRGGDHVYVQLMTVHMLSRPLVGTCWVSDLFLTSHGLPPIKTASNYPFMIFTHSHLKSEHHCSVVLDCSTQLQWKALKMQLKQSKQLAAKLAAFSSNNSTIWRLDLLGLDLLGRCKQQSNVTVFNLYLSIGNSMQGLWWLWLLKRCLWWGFVLRPMKSACEGAFGADTEH